MAVRAGRGIEDMDIDWLIAPKGRSQEVAIGDIKFLKMLEVIVAWKRGLNDEANSACGGFVCAAKELSMIIECQEILFGTKVTVKMMFEVADMMDVMCAQFLESCERIMLDYLFHEIITVGFEAIEIGRVEGEFLLDGCRCRGCGRLGWGVRRWKRGSGMWNGR